MNKLLDCIEVSRPDFARDFADAIKSDPREFCARFVSDVRTKKVTWDTIPNLQRLHEKTRDLPITAAYFDPDGCKREFQSTAFPFLMSSMVMGTVQGAYNEFQGIGDQLVTPQSTTTNNETIPRFAVIDGNTQSVPEAHKFPEITATEDFSRVDITKNGRTLSVTMEMVRGDKRGLIERLSRSLGLFARRIREKTILWRVTDVWGSANSPGAPYVYNPKSGSTALYSSSANSPGTRAPSGTRVLNNALADSTDLDAALARLATMKDDGGACIDVINSNLILLTPFALAGTAWKIQNSTYEPGVMNEKSQWGPEGQWRPTQLTSRLLDDMSTTTWYLGNFKEQFTLFEWMQPEYATIGTNSPEYVTRNIASQTSLWWAFNVGCADYTYVVQNLAATTPPTAPTI